MTQDLQHERDCALRATIAQQAEEIKARGISYETIMNQAAALKPLDHIELRCSRRAYYDILHSVREMQYEPCQTTPEGMTQPPKTIGGIPIKISDDYEGADLVTMDRNGKTIDAKKII